MCRSLIVLSFVLVAFGCSSPSTTTAPTPTSPSNPSTTAPSSAASELKAPGDAKLGERTTCPTSGEEFVVSAASPKFEYQGKTYYFCCGGCDAKFAKDPERYLKGKKPDA